MSNLNMSTKEKMNSLEAMIVAKAEEAQEAAW